MGNEEIIGARGWCKKCRHGKCEDKDVYCKNNESKFYGEKVNSVLCAPCFCKDKSKEKVEVQPVEF